MTIEDLIRVIEEATPEQAFLLAEAWNRKASAVKTERLTTISVTLSDGKRFTSHCRSTSKENPPEWAELPDEEV